jgi:DNA-binding transcriptional ArsR family regulator
MVGKPNPRFVVIERRQNVLGLLSRGLNECEIAADLKVGQSTISRDIKALNKESQEVIKTIELDYYPLEFTNIINSIRQVSKKAWDIINDETGNWTNKDKINAMKLIIDASRTKFEILQNGPLNLTVSQLREKFEKLQDQEEIPASFMPPILGPDNLENLR